MADPSQSRSKARREPLDDPPPPGPRRRHDLNATLKRIERELRRHSSLEDLGPLFGPQAQGREP
ncbi:MAG: hypothetical protein R6U00_01845 [Prochlorococcaceae cyanobacterium]